MENHQIRSTPEPSLRRLARYLDLLHKLQKDGQITVSSTQIGSEMSSDPTQVRKDIEYTGIIGKPKTGYIITELIYSIETFFNWNNVSDAFLVGAGNLGRAILGYEHFKKYGLNIVTAFDVSPDLIGTEINNIPILDLEKLTNLAQRMKIHIGVITTPVECAQEVADKMVEGGIKAIWNFAPVHLKTPEGIIVEHTHLTQSLAVLTKNLHKQFLLDDKFSGEL
jgi:redox-sensing transcriptional repressor